MQRHELPLSYRYLLAHLKLSHLLFNLTFAGKIAMIQPFAEGGQGAFTLALVGAGVEGYFVVSVFLRCYLLTEKDECISFSKD